MFYKVSTSEKEINAQPCAEYHIHGVESESEAISALYERVQNGLLPCSYLGQYSVPDYTCAFRVN